MLVVNARFLTQSITGVQRYAIEISLELAKLYGNQIVFVCPRNVIQKDYFDCLNAVVIGKRTGHLWEQIDLPAYLKKNDSPLLLNLCNTAPVLYNNCIVTLHDVAFKVYPKSFSKSFLWFYKLLIPQILRKSKYIVTVSEFSKAEIVKYYKIKSEKITVVYNATSSVFNQAKRLYEEGKYILAVSSVSYRKNFLAVLQAFEELTTKMDDVSLYIVGDLSQDSFSKVNVEKYKNNEKIKFLGRISDDDLKKYYCGASLFVYPSLYEGFGIPPIEAQMCGCPVLVSNIPVFREMLQDSAMFCDPLSVEDIAEKMRYMLMNENVLLIDKGYRNAKRYSWHQSALIVEQIINKR